MLSANSPPKLRSGKIIKNSYLAQSSSANHPNIDSEQINAANVDSVSNSSEIHQIGNNLNFQAETRNQILRLQAEISEIKSLLATLTQQAFSRSEEGNALRASSSRN